MEDLNAPAAARSQEHTPRGSSSCGRLPACIPTNRRCSPRGKRIERLIEREGLARAVTLEPGCSDAQLEALERVLPVRIPPGLAASLRCHDGVTIDCDELPGMADDSDHLLGCDEIAYEWLSFSRIHGDGRSDDFMAEITPDPAIKSDQWWRMHWIPIEGNDGFNCCLDLDPGRAGRVGQVINWDHERGPGPVWATSYPAWLAAWAKALEVSGDW